MQDYLTDNGRRDPISFSFVNNGLHPANIFEVHRNGKSIEAVLNADERKIPLQSFEFVNNEETNLFFNERSSDELNQEADRMLSAWDVVKFYRDNADDTVKEEYQKLLSDRMSDEGIRKYLKYRNLDAEIFFVS